MKQNSPKKKRLKRPARLEMAKNWIKTWSGKSIVKGYAKNFGVDKLCAIKELRMIGIDVSIQYEKQIRLSLEHMRNQKQQIKELQSETSESFDEGFAFIAGYTSGGFPYGITYDEMEENEVNELFNQKGNNNDLPF